MSGSSCRRRGTLRCWLLSAFALLAAGTWASTILLRPVAEIAAQAQVIVRATPLAGTGQAHWDASHRLILTRTSVRVLEVFDGDVQPDDVLSIETLGGFLEAEDIGMLVPGEAVLRADEEIILFLWRHAPTGWLRVLDLAAGKFEVDRTALPVRVTRRDLGSEGLTLEGAAAPVLYDNLVAQIRAGIAARPPVEPEDR